MTQLSRDEVVELARLARIELSDEIVERLRGELGAVLEYVAMLGEVDVTGVEPMTHAVAMTLRLREDNKGLYVEIDLPDTSDGRDVLVLIGETHGELGSSIYLREVLGREDGAPPPVDLKLERKTGDFVRDLIEAGDLTCVHDLSDGGLIGAAADLALASDCGVELDATSATHAHVFLFGEDQARYLTAVSDPTEVIAKAQAAGLHASVVGRAKGTDFASGELFRIPLAHLREMHEGWMPSWLAS